MIPVPQGMDDWFWVLYYHLPYDGTEYCDDLVWWCSCACACTCTCTYVVCFVLSMDMDMDV